MVIYPIPAKLVTFPSAPAVLDVFITNSQTKVMNKEKITNKSLNTTNISFNYSLVITVVAVF